jgi:hypothetical protein
MSRREVELLNSAVEGCRELVEARRKQKEIIVTNLENIAGTSLSDEEKVDIYRGFKKFGLETCANYIDGYLEERHHREEMKLSLYTFSQYINYQKAATGSTLDGRIRYFLGIVKRCTNSRRIKHNVLFWAQHAKISEEFIEEIIRSLKLVHPISKSGYMKDDAFVDWFHKWISYEYGECCEYHANKQYYDSLESRKEYKQIVKDGIVVSSSPSREYDSGIKAIKVPLANRRPERFSRFAMLRTFIGIEMPHPSSYGIVHTRKQRSAHT